MLYSIMIYAEDGAYERLPEDIQERIMEGHLALQTALADRGDYATVKLMPPSSAVTINSVEELGQTPLVVDGPFADTKETFLGIYIAEFEDLEEALKFAKYLASPYARIEIRPAVWAGGILSTE